MAKVSTWSTTAASNNSTPPDGWPEGQAPSTVNDCAREMMAQIRTQFEDSGWFDWGSTHTFVSGTSFTVATDLTDRYHAGRRIRAVGATTGTIYGTIDSSSFASPDTTVTIRWDTGAQLKSETLTVSLSATRAKSTAEHDLDTRNYMENGALDVWQDSRSETGVTATNSRIADFLQFQLSTHGTWTVDRTTTAPTVAQAGRKLNYSLRALCTTADATVAAGAFVNIRYAIEGHDYQPLFQQPQTLSFWARSTTTGTYCISLRNAAADRSYVSTFAIDAADTWEKKSFTITAAHTGTWNHTNDVGVSVGIALAAGTDFHTTADAWQTGNFLATSAQTNLAATVNNNFFVADMRLCKGYDTSHVVHRPFSEVLSLAQRRFTKSFTYDTKPAQNIGLGTEIRTTANSVLLRAPVNFPSEMRAAPGITAYNPASAAPNWRNITASTNLAAAVSLISTRGFMLTEAAAANDTDDYGIHYSADARL